MRSTNLTRLAAVAVLALATPATAQEYRSADRDGGRTILETASEAGSFQTLIAAVRAADLVETLASEGPFTLFAPTDAAFDELPEGTLEELLEPENRETLRSILLYHVVPGRVTAGEVVNLESAPTALGRSLRIRVDDGTVRVNGARVVKADVGASNGVIHVIDKVIVPASE